MPDISLIHGKSLVAAWEKVQEGVEVRQTDRYKMLMLNISGGSCGPNPGSCRTAAA